MTNFINGVVEPASLPRAEEINFKPIERVYWKVMQWRWVIALTVLLVLSVAILVVMKTQDVITWVAIIIPLILLFVLFYWLMRKSFLQKGYALRDRDILYRSGWLIRRIAACPFNRIQHCSIHAGPLEKKFGVATLQMFTAGTAGADIRIPGLKAADALALRDFLMKKTNSDEQGN